MTWTRTSILLLLFTSFCFAKAPYRKVKQTTLFNGNELYEYRLANGMRVLLVPRHQAKVLTYQMWFDVGSVDEKLDLKLKKTGLAHLFEHMMFRGTKKVPDGKFDILLSKIGGVGKNASTSHHRTNYYESIPSNQLETLLALESDRMKRLAITKDVFEKEKGAVVAERARSLDSPSRLAYNTLLETAYRKAPYRYTIIGTEAEIRGFTLEEANYFYRTYYAPNNAVAILVGSFNTGKVMDLMHKYYGDMKTQPVPKAVLPEEPKQKKQRWVTKRHRLATSDSVIMGYRIPPINAPDAVPLSLLSAHLSIGKESRMTKLLIDKGIATSAYAYPSSRPDLFFVFFTMAENHKAEEGIRILDREIRRLKQKPISSLAFDRALNQERLSLYGSIGNNSSLANWLGEYLLTSGNYLRGFEIIDAYPKMTPKKLQETVKKYLVSNQRSVVIVRKRK